MGGGALSVPLDALDGDGLAIAGGKAVNLGRLRKAGLPVPDGFCVTTRAYVLAADGLGADAPAALRELLRTRPVPDAVAEAVGKAYRELGQDVPVAVRSSATAEDLPAASFAGQHDTFLNVVGEEALLDAIRRCWASLWTDRAVAYRAANGIDPSSVQLAVIVQRMVDARAAGVMFTADPLTGRRGLAVIDVAPGLGEAVVSGAVNPDHFVVDTAHGTVLERAVRNPEPALDDEELAALAVLARRVETVYGGIPQDTEFAVGNDGRVWLLQARPITTLFPLPADAPLPGGGDLRVYFNFNVAQGVLRPLTPMGLHAFLLAGSGMAAAAGAPPRDRLAGPPLMKPAAGWLLFDVTPLVRSGLGRRLGRFIASRMEARTVAVLEALVSDPRLALQPPRSRSVAGLRRTAALLAAARIPARVVGALRDPVRGREEALRRARLLSEAPLVVEDGTAAQRFEMAERVLAERVHASILAVAPIAFAGLGSFGLAFRLLGRRVTADERDAVRRALPHNPTTQMDLALWTLATKVRSDEEATRVLLEDQPVPLAAAYAEGALPAGLQEGLGEFLRDYGHRGVAEIDLGLPRWGDDPAPVLSMLAGYLRRDMSDGGPQAQFRAVEEQAEALVEELARRRGRLLGPMVRFGLRRGRDLAGLREVPKAAVMALTARVRSELLAPAGRQLSAMGVLEHPDDLFFVDLREARSLVNGGDLRAAIRERRAVYDREVRRRHVPRVLLSDGTEPAPPQFQNVGGPALGVGGGRDGVLRGAPASAGVISGPAKVMLDPFGGHLAEGEILVAPSTDPGWTPLFLTASGLVMEMGGAMSHGAVVAREYGIPAVVGVPDATERIRSGDRVTVDGTAGTVVIGDAAPVPVWEPPIPGSTWVRRQVVEHMPDPLSPLFEDLYLREGLARSYDQIMELMAFPVHRMVDPPFFATVNGFAYSRGDIRLPPRMIPTMVRAMGTGMRLIFREALSEWRDRTLPSYLATVERWRRVDPAALPERELLRGVRELAWADAEYWFPVALVVGAAKVSDDLLRQFLRVVVRNEELSTGRFLRGYPSKTLEADAALEELADRIRNSDALRRAVLETPPEQWPEALGSITGGRAVLDGLETYFRHYGHQIYSLDFVEPTPADDRVPTLQSLQARVSRQSRDVQALRAALARQRDADVEQIAAALDPVRRRAFLAVLRWAQRHAPGREESLFYLGAAWPTLRELARELGHRLVSTGSIDDPDDVFFLESAELESVADGPARPELAERARQRRALREERRRLHAPAAVPPTARMRLGAIDMSSRETQKRNVETATTLSGFPVSPGRVTAPASVVLGPEHFGDMAPGSILVCPTTSPAWTPLFGQARGLVTDIGGVLAHGSIVAREYGIPAVMGTGNGTRRIRHGQTITIDGDRGVVELHEQ